MADADIRPCGTGDEIAALHRALKEHGAVVAADEQGERRYGTSTRKAVSWFERHVGLAPTGRPDEETLDRLGIDLPLSTDAAAGGVGGTVVLHCGVPAENLEVRVYTTTYGGERTLLGEDRTGRDGSFSIP